MNPRPQILESPDVIINSYRFAAASSIPSPTHYYVMDGTGNAIDSAGAEDLTEIGTVPETTGKNGNCRTFSSASNVFNNTSGNIGAIVSGDVTWSMSIWIKRSEVAANKNVASCYTGTTDRWVLRTFADVMRFAFDGVNIDSATSMSSGVYALCAFGYSVADDVAWIAVNNETPVTSADTNGCTAGTSLYLGRHATNTNNPILADMDELMVWTSDIRGSALTALYNSGTGKFWNGTSWA